MKINSIQLALRGTETMTTFGLPPTMSGDEGTDLQTTLRVIAAEKASGTLRADCAGLEWRFANGRVVRARGSMVDALEGVKWTWRRVAGVPHGDEGMDADPMALLLQEMAS